MNLAIFAEN